MIEKVLTKIEWRIANTELYILSFPLLNSISKLEDRKHHIIKRKSYHLTMYKEFTGVQSWILKIKSLVWNHNVNSRHYYLWWSFHIYVSREREGKKEEEGGDR